MTQTFSSWLPAPRIVRQFALLWGVFFGVLACWYAFAQANRTVGFVLAAVAFFVAAAGLMRPALVSPIYIAAVAVTYPIGWVVSHVLLAVVYFCLFTPLAWAFWLIGRDALRRSRRYKAETTYWLPKPQTSDLRNYLNPF